MMVAGNPADAVPSFKNALDINPTHHRARSKLGICLYEIGKKTQAVQGLTENNNLDRATLSLHYQTAILYCNRTKFARALISLEKNMHNNFTEADAEGNIQVALENLGMLDRAIATWDRLTETAHNAISARFD